MTKDQLTKDQLTKDQLTKALHGGRWADDLATQFPKFATGLTRAMEVVDTDMALPAGQKALFVAVIGAVKAKPDLVRDYLQRALDGGTTLDQIRGAGINLLISRGIPPHQLLIEALHELSDAPPEPGPAFRGEPTIEEMFGYYENLYGEVIPNVRLAAEHNKRVLDAYYLMRTAALEESPLEPRVADLLLCALNAAEYQELYVQIHARFALRGGATPAQLVESVACAIPFAGVAAWLPGANGVIAALEEAASGGDEF